MQTPNKLIITYYLGKSLKLFIKVKIKYQDQKSVNFKEIIQKTINTEIKMGLKSTIIV